IEIFKNKPPQKEENDTCAICLDDIVEKDSIWVCNLCHGILHHGCVLEWSAKTPSVYQWNCPMCRDEHDHIKPNDPKKYYQKNNPNRYSTSIINSSSSPTSSSNTKSSKFSKFRNSLMFKK
ncbi:hypothetical protein DICPUDRAFT_160276, partial [Dictyostelium purpureum]